MLSDIRQHWATLGDSGPQGRPNIDDDNMQLVASHVSPTRCPTDLPSNKRHKELLSFFLSDCMCPHSNRCLLFDHTWWPDVVSCEITLWLDAWNIKVALWASLAMDYLPDRKTKIQYIRITSFRPIVLGDLKLGESRHKRKHRCKVLVP